MLKTMLNRIALFVLLLAVPAIGLAASDIPLPRPRPVAGAASVPLPRPRPVEISSSAEVAAPEPAPALPGEASSSEEASSSSASSFSASSEEPPPPPRDYQVACPAVMSGQVTAHSVAPIHDGQCGLQSPLSLEAVSANGRSIPLSSTIITDCGMATALPAWVAEVDSYVTAHDKTSIETIDVSTNYECRNVDHAKTGNLSFHSFADALDIMGFKLKDGRTISIAPGFNGTPEQGSQILHFARDAACTHFMTVLSPDADSFHQDNMHLDLACHGKTCTARLCE